MTTKQSKKNNQTVKQFGTNHRGDVLAYYAEKARRIKNNEVAENGGVITVTVNGEKVTKQAEVLNVNRNGFSRCDLELLNAVESQKVWVRVASKAMIARYADLLPDLADLYEDVTLPCWCCYYNTLLNVAINMTAHKTRIDGKVKETYTYAYIYYDCGEKVVENAEVSGIKDAKRVVENDWCSEWCSK